MTTRPTRSRTARRPLPRLRWYGGRGPRSAADLRALRRLEVVCFGALGYTTEELAFAAREALWVYARDARGRIVAYTYAYRTTLRTAFIDNTVIAPALQGRGLVGPLIGRLERRMWAAGCRYFERNAMVANGYAATIGRHYRGRILRQRYIRTEYGRQRFFRIRLLPPERQRVWTPRSRTR